MKMSNTELQNSFEDLKRITNFLIQEHKKSPDIDSLNDLQNILDKINTYHKTVETYIDELDSAYTEKALVEEALKDSEDKMLSLLENTSGIFLMADSGGKIHYINRIADKYISRGSKKITELSVFDFISPENHSEFKNRINDLFETGKASAIETSMVSENGEIKYFQTHFTPIRQKNSIVSYIAILNDITEKKVSETIIENSLKEKEILLNEIHHRVKNNLQIILSFFSLQSQYIKDNEILNIFKECQNRIKTLSFLHHLFYQFEDFLKTDVEKCIRDLTSYLYVTYSVKPSIIRMKMLIGDISIDLDRLISCGLIINELVSNSLKYAFVNGERGTIKIIFKREKKGNYCLSVRDNGIGVPHDIDIENKESLGLQIVNILVQQLRGKVIIKRDNGTFVKILFPEKSI